MRKILSFILALMIFTSVELFAANIKANLNTGDGPDFEQWIRDNSNLDKLGHQNKLATGIGNAVAFTSNAASFSGYEGYDLFAFMWGMSVGVVIPPDVNGSSVDDAIKEEYDVEAGIGVSSVFNLGINVTFLKDMIGLGYILPNRLYMSIKGGKVSADAKDWSFKMSTFGLGLNYQLVDRGDDRFRLFKWTGLSLGSGFIYNRNKITFSTTFDDEKVDLGSGKIYTFTPKTQFGVDAKTYTI
ncbi:MAG: hypothetical protein FWG49_06290, partial [Leptospirales bacterium]|nr:hypothetical protein [Leptospirales bacterium]